MSVRERIVAGVVGQFHCPRGVGGHVAGWVMAHRPSNVARGHWAVSLLDVQPSERVLEIGFGPGIAIEAISRRATRGVVYGIDHSDVMVRMACRRNRAAVRAGRVKLMLGSAADVVALDEQLDAALAVNSVAFWPDPAATLHRLRTLLRPGGRIAVVSQPRCPGATEETSALAAEETKELLARSGFATLRTERLDLAPPAVCVLGVSSA